MKKKEVLQELEKLADYEHHIGAEYLDEEFHKLSEEEKKEFVEWLMLEAKNYSFVPIDGFPPGQDQRDNTSLKIRNKIKLFLEVRVLWGNVNIEKWLEEAKNEVEQSAQNIVRGITKRLNDLYPTKDMRDEEIAKQFKYYVNLIVVNSEFYDPLNHKESIDFIREYGLKKCFVFPSNSDTKTADLIFPSQWVKVIAKPVLEAKRIVELLKEIDKPKLCSEIPIELLSYIFKRFDISSEYFSEEHFVESVKKGEPLKKLKGKRTAVLYCIEKVTNKIGLENSSIVNMLHGGKLRNVSFDIYSKSKYAAIVKEVLDKFGVENKEE